MRTYHYRIYPTPRQVVILEAQLAFCSDLYNAALKSGGRPGGAVRINHAAQSRELTQYRREGGNYPHRMAALVQHEVLQRVDRASAAL